MTNLRKTSMEKTGKRVDVTVASHNHTDEAVTEYHDGLDHKSHDSQGIPYLVEERYMLKDVARHTPTHDCPDWARENAARGFKRAATGGGAVRTDGGRIEYIYRYDDRGDQICTNCGHVRNDGPDTVCDHQHAGRYDGFNAQAAKSE